MKLNRIIASLLALLMVISCAPTLAASAVETPPPSAPPGIACNHNWKLVSNSATCTERGYKTYRCSICGSMKREAVSSRGHAYSPWEITTPPTCEQEGIQTHVCSACGRTETRPVAALGHTFSDEWVITKEATVAEPGIISQVCSQCGAKRDAPYYIALGSAVLRWNDNDAEHAMTLTCNFALPPEADMAAEQPVMTVYLVKDGGEIIQPAAMEGRTAAPNGGVNQSWYFDSRDLGMYYAEVSLSFGGQTVTKSSNSVTLAEMLKFVPYSDPVPPVENEYDPGAEVELYLTADYLSEGPLRAGNTIDVTAKIVNVGAVPVVFLDSEGFEDVEGIEFPEALDVGESAETSGTYTITEEDVLLGYYYDPEDGYPVEDALDTSTLVIDGAVHFIYFGLDQANEPTVWDAIDSDTVLLPLSTGRSVLDDLVIESEYEKRFYRVGETIDIHYTITNVGPETLVKLEGQDFSEGAQLPETMGPGQSYSWTEQHIIKEEDLDYGITDDDADGPNDYASCVFGVSAVYEAPGLTGKDDVNWAYAEHYDIIDVEEDIIGGNIEITCDYDGTMYYEGDVVTVNYTITNTGNHLLKKIEDTFQGDPKDELAPGESFTWAETYEITKQMINEGTYYDPASDTYMDYETSENLLVGVFGGVADYYAPDVTEGNNAALGNYILHILLGTTKALPAQAPGGEPTASVKLYVTIDPKCVKSAYDPLDIIHFSVYAVNTGNVPLKYMAFFDENDVRRFGGNNATVKPGERWPSDDFDWQHIVHYTAGGEDQVRITVKASPDTQSDVNDKDNGTAEDTFTFDIKLTPQPEIIPADKPQLTLSTEINEKFKKESYQEGDYVGIFAYAVNTGNTDLYRVSIYHNGLMTIQFFGPVSPGDTWNEHLKEGYMHKIHDSGDGYDHVTFKAVGSIEPNPLTLDSWVTDEITLDLPVGEAQPAGPEPDPTVPAPEPKDDGKVTLHVQVHPDYLAESYQEGHYTGIQAWLEVGSEAIVAPVIYNSKGKQEWMTYDAVGSGQTWPSGMLKEDGFMHSVHDSGDGYDHVTIKASYGLFKEEGKTTYNLSATIDLPVKGKTPEPDPGVDQPGEPDAKHDEDAATDYEFQVYVHPEDQKEVYADGEIIRVYAYAVNKSEISLSKAAIYVDGHTSLIRSAWQPGELFDQTGGTTAKPVNVTVKNSGDGYFHRTYTLRAVKNSIGHELSDEIFDTVNLDLPVKGGDSHPETPSEPEKSIDYEFNVYIHPDDEKAVYTDGEEIRIYAYAKNTGEENLRNLGIFINGSAGIVRSIWEPGYLFNATTGNSDIVPQVVKIEDSGDGYFHRNYTLKAEKSGLAYELTDIIHDSVQFDLPVSKTGATDSDPTLPESDDKPELTVSFISSPYAEAKEGVLIPGTVIVKNTGKTVAVTTGSEDTFVPGDNPYSLMNLIGIPMIPGNEYSRPCEIAVTSNDLSNKEVKRSIKFKYTSEDDPTKEYWTNEAEVTIKLLETVPEPQLQLSMTGPASAEGKAGVTIPVTVKLENTGMTTVNVTNYWHAFHPDEYSDNVSTALDQLMFPAYAPEGDRTVNIQLIVDEDDLALKAVKRNLKFTYTVEGAPEELFSTNQADLDIPLIMGPEVPIAEPEAQIEPELTLVVAKLTAEPYTFDGMGNTDNIKYTLTVSNTGKVPVTVSRVDVYPPSLPESVDAGDFLLDPGKSMNLPYDTEFNDTEVESDGLLHITFKALGYIPEGKVPSNQVDVTHTVSYEPQDDWKIPPSTSVTVIKKETSPRKDPKGYREGEKITYSISVTNTSETTIPVLTVWDELLGANDLGAIFDLHPSETKTFDQDYYYYVTSADVPHHQVYNIARVTWIDPRTQKDMTAWSNPVTVPVLEDSDDTPPAGRKSCVLTLTGLGSGEAEYTQAFCAEHAKTQAKAEANALKDSDDPTVALAAWQEIRNAWKADLKEMAARLAEYAGNQSTAVNAEYEKFCAWADAREAQLTAQYPNEPQKAAKEAAELYMRETAMLCYLLNHAPETPRPDSRVGNNCAALDSGEITSNLCGHTVSKNDNGTLTIRDVLCNEHRVTDEVINGLFADAADTEHEKLFTRAQRLYQDALNAVTTAQYLAADEETQTLIAASRAALSELMKARKALLTFLYPDSPATVAEALSQAWREALVLSCADTPEEEKSTLAGTWTLTEMRIGKLVIPVDAATAGSFTLNGDGTAVLDGEQAGAWTSEGDQVTITTDDGATVFTLVDGTLQTNLISAVGIYQKQ